ncbi:MULTISPECIES: hypothetical protein [unclassified Rhizobium]|uniref:hypothetical protein n=1 Tax=unclassified Rhizobium TaxID=2613769 RepID=UPI0024787539|nr:MULTISPECIES: hypothetical protein [unclassified Rhizobium]MDH7801143.1 hypothetical protein [Rhizobium sp. AN70]
MTHLLIACALLTFLGPLQGIVKDASVEEIKIGFIVMLDGADRISGTAFCKTGKTCRLIEQESPKLIIDLKANRFYSEIEIDCEDDCSLQSGRRTMIIKNTEELYIYNGETGTLMDSVFRRREPIGNIMLSFPYPPR